MTVCPSPTQNVHVYVYTSIYRYVCTDVHVEAWPALLSLVLVLVAAHFSFAVTR